MNELPLFYHGKLARRTDPETSREAAEAIEPLRTRLRRQVAAYAHTRGKMGFTDYEMGQHFANHTSTYRTRRNELTRDGVIVPTDERRLLPSGRRAVVWQHRDFKGK